MIAKSRRQVKSFVLHFFTLVYGEWRSAKRTSCATRGSYHACILENIAAVRLVELTPASRTSRSYKTYRTHKAYRTYIYLLPNALTAGYAPFSAGTGTR